MLCTARANKTCMSRKTWWCVRGLKLVQPYTRANKVCQGKPAEKKLVHCTHEQVKLPRKLSRKTWWCVRRFISFTESRPGYFRGPLLREIYIRSFVLITPGLKVKYVSFLSDDTTTGPVRTGSGKGWKVTTSL